MNPTNLTNSESGLGKRYKYDGNYPWRDESVVQKGYTKITTLDELMAVHSGKAYWIVIRPRDADELGRRLHDVHSHLVIGTELGGFVETLEQAKALLPFRSVIDGMMTNRIDVVGPFFHINI